MTEELTEQEIEQIASGWEAAQKDWANGQPYAQYLPNRDGNWKDGYGLWIRWGRHQKGDVRLTWH